MITCASDERCVKVTDRGIKAINEACYNLQCLRCLISSLYHSLSFTKEMPCLCSLGILLDT